LDNLAEVRIKHNSGQTKHVQIAIKKHVVLKFNQGIVTALLWLDNQTWVLIKRQCTMHLPKWHAVW